MNAMTNTSPTAVKPMDMLKTMLNAPSVQEQFHNALKENKDAFVASLIEIYSSDKGLQTCQPRAVITEALKAAVMNLPINKALGFAYIVVYNNRKQQDDGTWNTVPTPTFILGYKGLIQMALRTSQYKILNADVIYEGELKSKDKLTGRLDLSGEKISDKVIGYFAHYELMDGGEHTVHMTTKEMAEHAKLHSPSIGRNTTVEQLIAKANSKPDARRVGWEGNFNAMAIKTVMRELLGKHGPLSIVARQAIAEEEHAEIEAIKVTAVEASAEEVGDVEIIEAQHDASEVEQGEEPQY